MVRSGQQKRQQLAGQGAILLCAILWSTSGLFIKLVDWHPVVIAGSRSLIAAVGLLVLRRFSRNRKPPEKPLSILAGGINYAVTMILFVIANKLTSSANAIVLQYTAPLWAALMAWFVLKEKPYWEHWSAFALVGLGMFMVFRSGLSRGSQLGDSIALVSGITFAANSVVLRMKKDGNAADIMISAHSITALFSIPFFVMYPPSLAAGTILSILFMGIFQIGVASALFVYGIRRIPAVQAMLTSSVEPVLNPLWVLLVTGEQPGLSVIAGGSLIVSAVLFSSVIGARRIVTR
jgi:drug/metabolite transporter (DMT)-like permease